MTVSRKIAAGGPLLRLEHWAAAIAGGGVLIMMLIGGLDIVSTAALSTPIPGAYEITETMMVASVFLALAMSQRERRQIRVELFTEQLGPRTRRLFDASAELFTFTAFSLIAWFGIQAAWTSVAIGEHGSGLIKVPVWPAKLALALGAVLMCAECLRGFISAVRDSMRGTN